MSKENDTTVNNQDFLGDWKVAIESALMFATVKHRGQKYGEMDYINHLSEVSAAVVGLMMMGEEYPNAAGALAVVGILHDILEDTETTYEELVGLFGVEISDVVECLTKLEDEDYDQYMSRLLSNPSAVVVKTADSSINLIHSINDKNESRCVRYRSNLNLLVGHMCGMKEGEIRSAEDEKNVQEIIDAVIEQAAMIVVTHEHVNSAPEHKVTIH